jgi:hypothetical protein
MQTRILSLAAAAALLLAPAFLRAQVASPTIPVGDLNAFPTLVQAGTFPQLTWSVTVPASVIDVITVTPPGTITPKRKLRMDVRVLGASVWASTYNSRGQVTGGYFVPTEALVRVGTSGSYSRIFYNTHNNINTSTIVHTRTVNTGNVINFAGRYYFDDEWSTMYNSTQSSGQVVALVNGSIPPTTTPLYQQPTIQSFILPYLDSQGRVKLGPRDVIYLMELTHTDKKNGGWDLQDLALLVTFTEI